MMHGRPNSHAKTPREQATYQAKLRRLRPNSEAFRLRSEQCHVEGHYEAAHKLEVMLNVLQGRRIVSLETLNILEAWIRRNSAFLAGTKNKGNMSTDQLQHQKEQKQQQRHQQQPKLTNAVLNGPEPHSQAPAEVQIKSKSVFVDSPSSSVPATTSTATMQQLQLQPQQPLIQQQHQNSRLESPQDPAAYQAKLTLLRPNSKPLRLRSQLFHMEGNHDAANKIEVMLHVLEGRRVASLEYLDELETWIQTKSDFLANTQHIRNTINNKDELRHFTTNFIAHNK